MARWQMRDRDEPPLTRHLKVARFALLSAYMLNSWCNLVVFDFFFKKTSSIFGPYGLSRPALVRDLQEVERR